MKSHNLFNSIVISLALIGTLILGAVLVSLIGMGATAAADQTGNGIPGGRIAFHSNRDGQYEVYTMNSDGSNHSRLTFNTPGFDAAASWSPDGDQIVFQRGYGSNYTEIRVMDYPEGDPDNVSSTLLASGTAVSGPRWSPDGSSIVFAKGTQDDEEIYRVPSDGSAPPTRLTFLHGKDSGPDWSPDGSTIAFASAGGDGGWDQSDLYLYLMDADGSNARPLLNENGDPIPLGCLPRWSPDGTKILLRRCSFADPGLYIVNSDGTGLTKLPTGCNRCGLGGWSPDGSKIVFHEGPPGSVEIFVINSNGFGEPINLSNSPGNDYTPDWYGIANRSPEVTVDRQLVEVDEGEVELNTGTVTDPDGDSVTLSASIGTVTNLGDGTWTWNFSTTDGPDESQPVTISASDGYNEIEILFDLVVNNVEPTIGSITAPIDPVHIDDQPIDVVVSFSDPGSADTHSVTWTWGDDTSDTQTPATSPASAPHTYDQPGVYSVVVTVTDDDGDSVSEPFEYVVIYNPEGGFVTGGGWIWSQPGWCQLDGLCAGAEGKANFGFVSKYKKGASVPTGNTEFNFKAGGLNFHSESYQWLVINQDGTNAQYKGSGTINSEMAPNGETYKFMLWAKDLGPSGDDTFRIKIWFEADGQEVAIYDNGFDQAIGGGNIQVHEGK